MAKFSYAIITVSDSCYNGTAADESGPKIRELIITELNSTNVQYSLVPDEQHIIEEKLRFFADELNVDLIFTTGGTGFAPRDVTPEATKNVITKDAPQLSLAMALKSLEKTKFAVLSRAVCGIRNQTLIVNFPGSKKAVTECFESVASVIPHALSVLKDELAAVKQTHKACQERPAEHTHVCPHKTGTGGDDRNSIYPMVEYKDALKKIIKQIQRPDASVCYDSPINIPPFRASIKDGYAVRTAGGKGRKTVVGYISAGDSVITHTFGDNEIFKINTGAPVPNHADCIIQVEDTKLLQSENGLEKYVEILVDPRENLDIRPIGLDLKIGEPLFIYDKKFAQLGIYEKSICAAVGQHAPKGTLPTIMILTTGDELVAPGHKATEGKIYDSNTILLVELLEQFGFKATHTRIVKDSYDALRNAISDAHSYEFVISTGGVSMGDKDYVKQVLIDLKFDIHFGRVNLKPGKPMTFAQKATTNINTLFFGLPGNPVSAFVTFHLFVLPALRYATGWPQEKCALPQIPVELVNDEIQLDARPEYARATIISKQGIFYAVVTENQISSRLKSIANADVLLHLPASTAASKTIKKGAKLKATILKLDFVSEYE